MYAKTSNQPEPGSSLPAKVADFIQRHALLPDSRAALPVLVGFSGGADSLALLVLLSELRIPVKAIHFHHHLRAEDADQDALWCREFCEHRHIPFSCHHLQTPEGRLPGESLEQAARRLRLEKWREIAAPEQTVALGHQADDCLETLLLRLARGSNVSGLTGLRPLSRIEGVRLIRPLLEIRREQIETYLHDLGLSDWRRDVSNRDPKFRRNAVRHQWLPAMRRTLGNDRGLLRSRQALQADSDYLEQAALNEIDQYPEARPKRLRELHPALLPRVLRHYLSRQVGHEVILRHQAVERLRAELAKPSPQPRLLPLGSGLRLQLTPNRLQVVEPQKPGAELVWPWREQPCLTMEQDGWELHAELLTETSPEDLRTPDRSTACFAAGQLPDRLTVRFRQPGDRMIPFGRKNQRRIKDLFNAASIPTEQRDRTPLILAERRIIWIPGVRRADFANLDPVIPTTPTLRLTCRKSKLGQPD